MGSLAERYKSAESPLLFLLTVAPWKVVLVRKKVGLYNCFLLSVDLTNFKNFALNLSSNLVLFSVAWISWQGEKEMGVDWRNFL